MAARVRRRLCSGAVAAVLLSAAPALSACNPPAPVADATPTVAASAPASPSGTPSAVPPAVARPKVSRAALAYFFKIALGAEYGDELSVVVRWTKPVVTVRTDGTVSAASRDCLERVVADFNALSATTKLRLTGGGTADIRMFFGPVSRFRAVEPAYVRDNDGFFSVKWAGDHAITAGTVLIRTTGIGATVRCHLIREELTQSMGLMRDADDYPDSVFYGRYWATPTRYSRLDEKLIRLLYGGAVHPGDGRDAVTRAVIVS
ncbi:hypothetical protein Asp14428_11390 [Actinoplanes sp. NBRC 14428]|nr:hypothetical protein Asp14428_11390 [Actinoplanes sp. NBRC 14428]